MKLHLKATQHHSYDVAGEDKSEAEIVDEVEDALVIPDGPCLIPCMKVFLMDTFETTYDLVLLIVFIYLSTFIYLYLFFYLYLFI